MKHFHFPRVCSLDFTIEDESGNYVHWFYTVHYTEYMSHLPAVHNYAVAHFEVRPLSETSFVIHSTHQTCFYTSLACGQSLILEQLYE